ncbi:MAG: class F sortase [Patescibacteria group bacterium]
MSPTLHITREKNPKAISVSGIFQCIFSGLLFFQLAIVILGFNFSKTSFEPAQVLFAKTPAEKIVSSGLPRIARVDRKEPEVPVKIAAKKVTLATSDIVQKLPAARLKIPKITVDASIIDMGLTENGAMAVPNNRVNVGWFSLGTRPGQTGSAVIGAHNRWNSQDGVFAHLDQLEIGDIVSIVDTSGISISFVVRDFKMYDATDTHTNDIFESENGAHLNLITCSGDWDPATKSFAKRLIIFTDLVDTPTAIAMVPQTL